MEYEPTESEEHKEHQNAYGCDIHRHTRIILVFLVKKGKQSKEYSQEYVWNRIYHIRSFCATNHGTHLLIT